MNSIYIEIFMSLIETSRFLHDFSYESTNLQNLSRKTNSNCKCTFYLIWPLVLKSPCTRNSHLAQIQLWRDSKTPSFGRSAPHKKHFSQNHQVFKLENCLVCARLPFWAQDPQNLSWVSSWLPSEVNAKYSQKPNR